MISLSFDVAIAMVTPAKLDVLARFLAAGASGSALSSTVRTVKSSVLASADGSTGVTGR